MNRVFQHARANAIVYLALCASTWLVGLAVSSNAQAGDAVAMGLWHMDTKVTG